MVRKKTKSVEQKTQRFIYIGPTLKTSKLLKYQVFIGGLPTHINDVFEKCPQIKQLFVPTDKFIAAEKQVKQKGTPLNKYYNQKMHLRQYRRYQRVVLLLIMICCN